MNYEEGKQPGGKTEHVNLQNIEIKHFKGSMCEIMKAILCLSWLRQHHPWV